MLARATAEIEELHDAFEQWFRAAPDQSFDRIDNALTPEFVFIGPNAELVERADVVAGLRDARGTRDLSIRIEAVRVGSVTAETVVATYEEWHDHPDHPTCRQATVVFGLDDHAPHGLVWHHIHETWKSPPPHRTGG
jgi:hypothetical protein